MHLLDNIPTSGHILLASVPEGADALMLANLLERHGRLIYVARDDVRMARMQEMLDFFAPHVTQIHLPAWDCLPYDRISPNPQVVSERMKALSLIAGGSLPESCVVLTTINSLIQRVPPKELLAQASFHVKVGTQVAHEVLIDQMLHHGYVRSGAAAEPGEFALRGSILDIFPSGGEVGYRLDFFGDTLESIRTFDPLTQISGGTAEELHLFPASEVLLNEQTIARFRQRYREQFGAVTQDDPLYEAISESRKYAGCEHWLPLYYPTLDTLFDLLPDTALCVDHLVSEARETRLATIDDYYKARLETGERGMTDGVAYHPVPPESLYVLEAEWHQLLARRTHIHFTPFAEQAVVLKEGVTTTTKLSLHFTSIPSFAVEAKKTNTTGLNLFTEFLLERLQAKNHKHILVGCYSEGARSRLEKMLAQHECKTLLVDNWKTIRTLPSHTIGLGILPLEKGFETPDSLLISEQDILGERIIRSTARKKKIENFLSDAASLMPNELVVHREHGIGRFLGLETLTVSGITRDFLLLLYAGDDKLYVPVENIEVLTRYGSDEGVALDRLGAGGWQERKARLKKRIQIAAEELLRIAAERAVQTAPELEALKGMYDEFCARFPYAETEDQLRAIEEIEEDLISGKPMDRLVCGDVGFGKTEVALRAAFIAVSSANNTGAPSQVAVITPTTLLSRQHYKTFKERFAGFPIRIKQLSRLVSAAEAKRVKDEIKEGQVDIIIGTHALLSKQIEFKNLSLLIVDEEQHFGVAQKERLKQLRSNIHVLTLSATPIPRTLQMALSGIKTLSLIATPPVDRLAVRTFVMPYDPVVLREAMLREHYRGGRIFYVCPRISDLHEVKEKLTALVPEIKVMVAHGQMPGHELDDIMNAFYDGKFDLLLSTTIVESGLDIPMANTIIIHRADQFGLGQLYQLRGRVGRSNLRAYAYLTLPPKRLPTKDALKRLEVMQSLDTLGAGFTVASHDMDIRGFGNMVGEEQSGHIREVGIELYQDMLKQAITQAKQETAARKLGQAVAELEEDWSPQINLGISVLIPENYVNDLHTRLTLYRRLSNLQTREDVEGFAAELVDRFGALPEEAEHLLTIIKIKQICKQAGIEKIETGPKGAVIAFRNNHFANPEKLLDFIQKNPTTVKLRSDQKLVIMAEWKDTQARLSGISASVGSIGALAA
jgi:transcription-repair coupling factor (superfamily II helicase)